MNPSACVRSLAPTLLVGLLSGCGEPEASDAAAGRLAGLMAAESTDYCALPPAAAESIVTRPQADEEPIDDVNWFARPVPQPGPDRIVAFASHNQNHLYDLTRGVRVKIPDRSDAVATPDGRYMTVPSTYTPDSNIRFYPLEPLLEALAEGRDATDVGPAYVYEHPSMKRVYYQSTGVVSTRAVGQTEVVHYRLMFSGGHDETNFRIVDYRFTHDRTSGALLGVEPSGPMALCPDVRNDLNTPFISKDGRYVAAYTSDTAGSAYSPGASLKVLEITGADPAAGTTTCREVVDFGFAAGKADFSFDGSSLTFHISHGGYLTPFINGGLPGTTITDVVVARLLRDRSGAITGAGPLRRLTTSTTPGVGSYFPAYFPDGTLFYVANAVPKESDAEKRFHFHVVEPGPGRWLENLFADDEARAGWEAIAGLWESACAVGDPALAEAPFPLQPHEAPWLASAMTAGQCEALVGDAREDGPDERSDWDDLTRLCGELRS